MDRLTDLSKKYSGNSLIRGVISIIPYVGGGVDILLSDKWNKFYQRRVDNMLEQLSNDLKNLENRIDEEYLNSEEFFDTMYKVLAESTKTRLDEKRKIYSKIVRDSVLHGKRMIDTESILGIITELDEKDLMFIHYIFDYKQNHSLVEFSGEMLQQNKALNIEEMHEIVRLLFRFSYLGLLNYKMNVLTLREKVVFSTTPLYDKIINYLKE